MRKTHCNPWFHIVIAISFSFTECLRAAVPVFEALWVRVTSAEIWSLILFVSLHTPSPLSFPTMQVTRSLI